ncbi:MAG: helix-turn-helix domain-containing protein [Bacteriovorax sp.]
MVSSQVCPQLSLGRIVFKLRYFRELAKHSQQEAADKLNLGHRSYQRIENGEAKCDIAFLYRFCLIFNVDILELVTPYAPGPQNLILYKTKEEEDLFQGLSYVQQTGFLDCSRRLEKNFAILGKDNQWMNSEYPFCLWTHSKKTMNEAMMEKFGIQKKSSSERFNFLLPKERLNFFDCLYYHRPKYSLKKHLNHEMNGLRYDIEIYSAHLYLEEDVINISILKFDLSKLTN